MVHRFLNILIATSNQEEGINFKNAIVSLKISSEIIILNNESELMECLLHPNLKMPDILFLDIEMPCNKGAGFLEIIRSNQKFENLTISVFSNYVEEHEVKQVFEKGANVFIHKPKEYDLLESSVKKVINTTLQYKLSGLNRGNFILRV